MKNQLITILKGKCPKCQEGDFFITSNPYFFGKMFKMNDQCTKCGCNFYPEPGFYFGAMYVSYAFSVGIFLVTSFMLYHFFGNPELNTYIITVVIVSMILYPVNFRYSRILYFFFAGNHSSD